MKTASLFFSIFVMVAFTACKKAGIDPVPVPPLPVTKVFYTTDKFVMGADLSSLNGVQDYGGVYKDSGTTKDTYTIFKNHGADIIPSLIFQETHCPVLIFCCILINFN